MSDEPKQAQMARKWRTSPYCGPDNGCVEWAVTPQHVLVRDSKDRHGSPVHVFSRAAFAASIRTQEAAS